MDGCGDEQLFRSADSESEGEFDEQDRELDDLYSESESEYHPESDVDYDDRFGPRDDASDDLSDAGSAEAEPRGLLLPSAADSPMDLEGLSV